MCNCDVKCKVCKCKQETSNVDSKDSNISTIDNSKTTSTDKK